jgi:hypothetical protein
MASYPINSSAVPVTRAAKRETQESPATPSGLVVTRSWGTLPRSSAINDEGLGYGPLSAQLRWQGNDVATAGLIENWIDETERRNWFLTDIGRAQ